jgi:hypothetical protein
MFQFVETRILSVVSWYHLAFFAIAVAMLGMTVGAVWIYLAPERFVSAPLDVTLSRYAWLTAVSIPCSLALQFSLVSTVTLSLTTIVAWSLLLAVMAMPYVFCGVVVALALTRTPFPVADVYAADLVGAASGCLVVLLLLGPLDGPSVVIVSGIVAALGAVAFAVRPEDRRRGWRAAGALAVLVTVNAALPVAGLRPIVVKDDLETGGRAVWVRWNSYSRVSVTPPLRIPPMLWAPSPTHPAPASVDAAMMKIDGAAGTMMFGYDGAPASVDYLRDDLVNLAYWLPGLRKAAIIGVGGGRDVVSAHIFGAETITAVELNPLFVDLLTRHPLYSKLANVNSIPDLTFHVDDARSWFAGTRDRFDIVQMSMIDTWAATASGAFTLSENGLYTIEGWRTFLDTLNPNGVFTVSRWYSSGDIDESARLVSLAVAALLDRGVRDPRAHLFVAHGVNIATLVVSPQPLDAARVATLQDVVKRLGFELLLTPADPPASPVIAEIAASRDIAALDRIADRTFLNVAPPTDERPFFFNQLRFSRVPGAIARRFTIAVSGVVWGNLVATGTLMLILVLSTLAAALTIVIPLGGAARSAPRPLVVAGTVYFALIGVGFMLAEIALMQRFSVYLGHPSYSLGVSLFSLILSTGAGSLLSRRVPLTRTAPFAWWNALVVVSLCGVALALPRLCAATMAQPRGVRMLICVAAMMPLGLLFGFAFPTGLTLVERVDRRPAPWFWGINGAMSVVGSVVAVMVSLANGITATLLLAAACYAALWPAARALMASERPL